ncbi:DEAD/DEAH box helicase family protein [Streptomyces phaeochromogenes]|uniref:DEAD/DEAH box helicase family protein n=1 Tax=Streptomyces phaeochromogenes TaxID=1923 RepID=A0ABZ1HRU4_STRPH|nr:DEAD/DEAH box helicase family protein [Streptomyces phaeochromogenes]WSD21328.1 DEAD/DEAH box helicase family protein [Streptomyces phaeochromogenes]
MELRPHQAEAVDNVVRILGVPPGGRMPPEGLRTQVIAATGSGKTLIGAESAHRSLDARASKAWNLVRPSVSTSRRKRGIGAHLRTVGRPGRAFPP